MLNQKLTVKTVQSLAMTKQLQQSLKILQMNTIELKEFVDTQILENPFIDFPEGAGLGAKENFEEHRYESARTKENDGNFREDYISRIVDNQITLKQHLIDQIFITIHDNKEKLIAVRFTDSLDDNGYLTENISEIATTFKCETAEAEAVLNKLYKLDPIGAYARNLQECLSLQLKEKGIYDEVFANILANLEGIAKGEINKLIKMFKITLEEFKIRMASIKKLDPKPGRNFFTHITQTLVPDAFIFFDTHANLVVKLNNEHLPSINLNSNLYKETLENLKTKDDIIFCKHRFHDAMFIARALEQRANTIFQVTSAIAEEQYEFFEKGINYLKPMTLADIAKKTNLHESTISRISNKTIATVIGTFEIKYFFTSKIKSNFAENIYSSSTIKNKIKELIEDEQAKEVLADDKISAILQSRGIDISRRTVTKYREAMNIPSSHQRKRLKAAAS
ncbi:hypothetical protein NF27_DP01820 [Candidatus Jidaibacter acanthamoeba]|uniref:RNA polymerase sigma-54 factor n=1 Tax=Candidatus Jidaibacter acanthamoebae TaxID=86105 RepID=A0A0C1QNK9_9RICK|nr:RNA polymerase factor sigma-54 [Candidatus Jidaibacter acanthamoeba]KIE05638.1 hypothetical protein NF27_DP01820 [Candidatus Jidaibacter acanthamoeba]